MAYADLVTLAGDMQLFFAEMSAMRRQFVGDHRDVIALGREGLEIGKQLARAIAMVQLVGSEPARAAAKRIDNAANAVRSTLEPPQTIDSDAAVAAVRALFDTVDVFVDAVRPVTAADA